MSTDLGAVIRFTALLGWVFLQGCGPSDPVSPGTGNATMRVFDRPFSGQFANSWPFDHDLPLGVFSGVDRGEGSPDVLDWRGKVRVMAWGDGRWHDGYDWPMPEGTPLLAVADGEVVFAGSDRPIRCGSKGEVAALVVRIRSVTGTGKILESLYGHLSEIEVDVGARVRAGQEIGRAGQTGCASAPHLHFGVFRIMEDGRSVVVDPFGWEGAFPDPWQLRSGVRSEWLWKKGQAPQGDYSY